jgi:hypothetical protein
MRRTKAKKWYVLLDKRNNTIKISSTKQYLADIIGVHVRTINRNMDKNGIYNNDYFTLWSDVPENRCVRGWAL